MSEFYAVLTGPLGCDHSIACGTKVVSLAAGNWAQAEAKAREQYDHHGGEDMVTSVEVFEVASRQCMDTKEWANERHAANEAREMEEARVEFARLAKKLGVTLPPTA